MAYVMKTNIANKNNYGNKRSLSVIEYIVIHYTANDGDTDESNGRYFRDYAVDASAHYFVDDDSVTQSVPDDYVAWHCGGGLQGSGGHTFHKKCMNTNSIGIEICDDVKNGVVYPSQKTIDNAIALTKMLMKKYNVPASKVIRHYDVTGKICPGYWCGNAEKERKWKTEFWNKISGELSAADEPEVKNYLMVGDTGSDVKKMQESLIKLGYSCGVYGADADFGSGTEDALKRFQKDNGLSVDGKYGEKTKAKVESLLKQASTPRPNRIDTVKEVQGWANANYKSGLVADGIYGANTKRALVKILQTEINRVYKTKLDVDGIWGAKTKAACPTLKKGFNNNIVEVLQSLLICNRIDNVYVDGDYGTITESAVKSYQKKSGLSVDGIVGKDTFAKLCG